MARQTSRLQHVRIYSVPGYLFFLAFAVSSFSSCIEPNSGMLSSGTEADSTDNPKRGLGMDKETFKKALAQDIETLKGNITGCPSFPRSGRT